MSNLNNCINIHYDTRRYCVRTVEFVWPWRTRAAAADPMNRYCCARSPVDQISPLGASLTIIIKYDNNVRFNQLHNIVSIHWNINIDKLYRYLRCILFCSVQNNNYLTYLTYFNIYCFDKFTNIIYEDELSIIRIQ